MGERDVRIFEVKGQYGPMTLAFEALGRHSVADSTVTAADALALTQEEVQRWYEERGWPRAGWLVTLTPRGRYKGQFRLI